MTVRRQILLLFSLVALGLSAGCGGGDSAASTPEVDDPYFRAGQQLVKQGREQEALSSYLKAIEHRGGYSSAESHLEAGLIYLNHSKDPVEAYHHFREYLSQQPNSRDSARVRDLLTTAKRDFFRSLAGRDQSLDNANARSDLLDRIEAQNRTIEALNAELIMLRGSATAPVMHQTRTPIDSSIIRPVLPEPVAVTPTEEPSPITPAPAPPPRTEPVTTRPTPTRPAQTQPAPAQTQSSTLRKHVVAQGDTLFGLAKKYYGTASNAKADAIYEANRDVMKNKGDLRPGMEIKIP